MRTFVPLALVGALLLSACGYAVEHGPDGNTSEDSPTASASDSTPGAAATTTAPDVATVGMTAPDFTLTDVNGKSVTLSEFTRAGKTVVLEWFNPDCPVTKAYYVPEPLMAPVATAYADQDVVWLAINSGGPGQQGNGVERNLRAVGEFEIPYPVLLDESGSVGRRYAAKRTPHMYVIDAAGTLRYAGAIDDGDSRTPGKLNYVAAALDALLADADISMPTTTAFGCSVKYAKTYE